MSKQCLNKPRSTVQHVEKRCRCIKCNLNEDIEESHLHQKLKTNVADRKVAKIATLLAFPGSVQQVFENVETMFKQIQIYNMLNFCCNIFKPRRQYRSIFRNVTDFISFSEKISLSHVTVDTIPKIAGLLALLLFLMYSFTIKTFIITSVFIKNIAEA